MAPKKSKASKMSLNEFLGDSTLGSWADEMDSLPTAPSIKTDEDKSSRPSDRFGRRDDFTSSRPDRLFPSVREEVPLPSHPPFTAFIGNLAFDITEQELASFFSPHQAKSIKIIKDRDDKPKGFGYIEFVELDALKDALSRTGSSLSGRVIRVSVAEPPKEKPGFSGATAEEDSKLAGSWRRDGPLPSLSDGRDISRRRFDGHSGEHPPSLPGISDEASDWRSSRPLSKVAESEAPLVRRKGSGFSNLEGQTGAADKGDHWTIGSRFKPSGPEESAHGKFSSVRSKHESVHTRDTPDEGDWRARRAPGGTSPSNSTPPTPQISRKKLELLPRSSTGSTSPSPLSSPKLASNAPRSNPFGAAKPVDVSVKEREVSARLELAKDRAPPQHSMSRTNSRQATERGSVHSAKVPSASLSPASTSGHSAALATATVRPSFSFANAAGAKTTVSGRTDDQKAGEEDAAATLNDVTDQAIDMSI